MPPNSADDFITVQVVLGAFATLLLLVVGYMLHRSLTLLDALEERMRKAEEKVLVHDVLHEQHESRLSTLEEKS